MKLAVICPLSRKDARLLLANVARQTMQEFSLIIIESKLGVGATSAVKLRPQALIKSEAPSVGAARNVGLDIARALQMTHVAWFDDDDYYGPGYLAEAVAALRLGHRVVGKCAHFTALENRQVILRNSGDVGDMQCERLVTTVPGCTLAHAMWDGMPRFDESMAFGEDTAWCAELRKPDAQGGFVDIWATSPFHFCYVRRGYHHGHTYPARDRQLLSRCRGETYDVGAVGHSTARLIDSGDMAELKSRLVLRERVELSEKEEAEYARAMGPVEEPADAIW